MLLSATCRHILTLSEHPLSYLYIRVRQGRISFDSTDASDHININTGGTGGGFDDGMGADGYVFGGGGDSDDVFNKRYVRIPAVNSSSNPCCSSCKKSDRIVARLLAALAS